MKAIHLLTAVLTACTLAITACGKRDSQKAADEGNERIQAVNTATTYLSTKYDIWVGAGFWSWDTAKTSAEYDWSKWTPEQLKDIENHLIDIVGDVRRVLEIGDRNDVTMTNKAQVKDTGTNAQLFLNSLNQF